MSFWKIKGKIIRTVSSVLCTTVVHSDMHTHEQFLYLTVGLGLGLGSASKVILFMCCLLLLSWI